MSLFRPEVFEAQRRKLHGDVILVQPLSLKVIAAMFIVIGATLLTFAATREYTRKETARGYIVPETGTTAVRATRGGELMDLLVVEGQSVAIGAPLFESRLDVETSDGFVSERRLDSLQERLFQVDMREAEMKNRFQTERQRLQSIVTGLEAEVKTMARRADLQAEVTRVAEERLAKFGRLLREEVISQIEYDSIERQSYDSRLALSTLEQQKLASDSSLRNARFQLGSLPSQKREEVSRLAAERAQLEEVRASVDAQTTYIVRAPVSGTISAIGGRVGEQMDPLRPVVVIIPDDTPLEAIILVPSSASGFIAVGNEVNLLLDAFPYQKFGSVSATVKEVSATPFLPGELVGPINYGEPVYRVRATLSREAILAYGEDVALKPGMTLVGDIVLDRRTILEWMFEPLLAAARRT